MEALRESAIAKLGSIPLDALPADRNDILWRDFAVENNLTTAELSILKNLRCSAPSGIIPPNSLYKFIHSIINYLF